MMQVKIITYLFRLECIYEYRSYKEYLFPMLFYVMVMVLYPIAFGTDGQVLQYYFPAMTWIAIMLSVMLALKSMFELEYQKNILEYLIFNRTALVKFVATKIIINWLLTCLPLLVIVPISGFFFEQPISVLILLELSILLVTPILFLLGAIFSSLTFGLSQKTLLKMILSLPLFIPILILAVLFVTAQAQVQHLILILLIGILCCLSILAPWLTALLIENGVYD